MTELESAARRLIAARNRDPHWIGCRADLWNDLFHALEAMQANTQSATVAAGTFALAASKVREARS